ncbi:DUF898 family protein [Brevundimonas sp.]|uniref:YjgN family protein n=1 Tax=Brevundimonas sp. TaxID=1871086 RepID=UPI0025BC9088|nr:DUF898 family protein [Brevundimonas sp.]MBA4332452.1 hypothetical protein [Brevundimonas sp.]
MTDITEDAPTLARPLHDALGPISDPDEGAETLVFSTTLQPSKFLGLSLKNGLLNIVTLTLWRFWGKTEVRRRVWSGVRLNDEAFEYTGRGVELFVGFLLALVVLDAPLLLVVFAGQFLHPALFGLMLMPLYLFIYWLWGFGVFSAFRYMASRTTWRGIRFRLTGSAAIYGVNFLGYLLLSSITLGWFWPTAERKLSESLWDGLRFGDRRLAFRIGRAEKKGVYGAYAIGWFGTAVSYILLVVVVSGVAFAHLQAEPAPTPDTPVPPDVVVLLGVYAAMAVLAPIFLLVWAPYKAAMLRSVAHGVTMDSAGFVLNVKALPLWWLTVSNMFLIIVTLGFLMPWAQARTARFLVQRLKSAGKAKVGLAHQTGRGPGSGEGLADAFGFSAI